MIVCDQELCTAIPLFSDAIHASIYNLRSDKYRSTWLCVLKSVILVVAMSSSFCLSAVL